MLMIQDFDKKNTSEEMTEKSRQKNMIWFSQRLKTILDLANNPEDIAEGINKHFYMLKRFIKIKCQTKNYNKNNNNLFFNDILNKLIKYLKRTNQIFIKKNNEKVSKNIQFELFTDICKFINWICGDTQIMSIFSTFPRTPIQKYNVEKVWEQFSQLIWLKKWGKEVLPDWWSCHYRTLLLYNFFSQLNEIWIDLDIVFFRQILNNGENGQPCKMGHSWLVITFQWQKYIAERFWGSELIVENIQSLINNLYKKFENNRHDLLNYIFSHEEWHSEKNKLDYLINFYSLNFMNRNVNAIRNASLFNNLKDFINNLVEYPSDKQMKFNIKCENKLNHIFFSFIEYGFRIFIDYEYYDFYLDIKNIYIKFNEDWYYFCDSDGTFFKSPSDFCKFLSFVSVNDSSIHRITQNENEVLDKILPFILKRVNITYSDFFPNELKHAITRFGKIMHEHNNNPFSLGDIYSHMMWTNLIQ